MEGSFGHCLAPSVTNSMILKYNDYVEIHQAYSISYLLIRNGNSRIFGAYLKSISDDGHRGERHNKSPTIQSKCVGSVDRIPTTSLLRFQCIPICIVKGTVLQF